ncbi:MAG: ExeM/NucH family extracellular endonuclease [Halieaceae bacterium]|nr:ExeM/NucH family extracellular endonuclease [Halieaceae bacterium]
MNVFHAGRAAALLLLGGVAQVATAQVFINEFHYDNGGADTGEAVEVAGLAGTTLDGYSLVFYNGSNGTSYATLALSGSLPDQCGGYGTAVFSQAGIQNGAPDGIALVDDADAVVEFLSYEGDFVAVDGPASGLSSTDILVFEPGDTPVGQSLQRSGAGITASDFSWGGPLDDSFGLVNASQDFNGFDCPDPVEEEPPVAVPGDVFISEIHYDNDGTDSGEAIEITGPAGQDLSGWSIVLYNGNGGGPYNTLDLGGILEDCGNSLGVTVVELPSNGLQNGSPDGLALVNNEGTVLEFLSYEGQFTAAGGPADGIASDDIGVAESSGTAIGDSLQRELDRSAWNAAAPNSFGELNDDDPTTFCPVVEEPEMLACGDEAVLISAVQGSGFSTPLDGQVVTVDAVVVGVFPDLNGYFLQEEDADADADPLTSEGLFVFDPGASVTMGDQVIVRGEAGEFFGMTQISEQESLVCGTGGAVTAAKPTLPVSSIDDFEAFEGMSVVFEQELTISEYFNFDRFGEMVLALPERGDRPYQPTNVLEPGPDAAALQDLNDRSRITLDDGRSDQNPALLRHPNGEAFSVTNRFRGGDTVWDVTGVLNFAFGLYRIQPTAPAQYSPLNLRPDTPDEVGGSLKVASFNVLNFFTTLDEPGNVCGPNALGCRGADTPEELERQRTKILAALQAIDADIVGLIELENDDGTAIADLVAGLNAAGGDYDFIDTGAIGGDAIKVGFIYRPGTVMPAGNFAILDSSVDPRFIDTKNRPVLAQTFVETASAARFTVAVNHFKSKGSACDDVGDPLDPNGQGNCNGVRSEAAAALVDWLASDPTGSGDADVMIIGDLNAYAKEDPIDAVLAGSDDTAGTGDDYVDLVQLFEGDLAYSFVFSGQFGYLDHALANGPMLSQVTGLTEWHINADEPDALDYDTSFNPPELYEPNAFRSSDHDPIVVGLAPRASLADLGGFIDDAVAAGTLEGTGRRPAVTLKLFEGLLDRALKYDSKGLDFLACFNLARAAGRVDGEGRPKDWVAGDAAQDVLRVINQYRDANCSH